MWGRLAACGGLLTRPERRLTTGAQLDKLPHKPLTKSRGQLTSVIGARAGKLAKAIFPSAAPLRRSRGTLA